MTTQTTYAETTYCPECHTEVIVPADFPDDPTKGLVCCEGCGLCVPPVKLLDGWTEETAKDAVSGIMTHVDAYVREITHGIEITGDPVGRARRAVESAIVEALQDARRKAVEYYALAAPEPTGDNI